MKKSLKLIILILVLTLIVPSIAGMAAGTDPKTEEHTADLIFFEEVLNLIKESYPFEVEESDLIVTAVKSMLKSLDPYSDYYTKEETEGLMGSLTGSFSGIGIYIEEKDGYITVVSPIKGQPAEKAGIRTGDLIVAVDDIDIKDMGVDKASALIKGPVNTTVKLKVKREDRTLTFNVKRATITISPVYYEIMEKDIGYISLDEFSDIATKDIKKALAEFDKKGIEKVILDLRDNPGGFLDEAVSIGRLFVPVGPIVYVRDKNNRLTTHRSYLSKQKYQLVVLVNGSSASASEIVAGAVKDRKAGVLVGSQTFGKALVQNLIPINDGSLIKMTTAVYLTPNKTLINGIGIEPDYLVENDGFQDLQLMKALEILSQQGRFSVAQ
ncbi:MAG: S41 family peptidase [Tissierellaceae bacterium]